MVENKKGDNGSKCPINEWVRHGLYVGGMVALHSGLCASATVAHKTDKCPVSEWSRHLVYVGGCLALAAKTYGLNLMSCPAITKGGKDGDAEKEEEDKCSACPVNEWVRHVIYVAGCLGLVAMVNSRKK